MNAFKTICYYFGLVYILKKLILLLYWIYKTFLLPSQNLLKKYGSGFCIITGGSVGIGYSFAKQFMNQGFKILLISSKEEKLKKAKQDLLKENPNATIEILQYNLSQSFTNEIIKDFDEKISSITKGEEISILINNAGVITRKFLCDLTDDQIRNMLNVNTISLVFITKIIIEKMLKRNKKSLIIGSGSVMGRMRLPTRSIYGSTKCFLQSFYEILQREYGKKIDFTTLEIGPVETELNQLNMPFKINSDIFAKNSINFLGKYNFTTGCLKHEIMNILFWKIPFFKEYTYNFGMSKYT